MSPKMDVLKTRNGTEPQSANDSWTPNDSWMSDLGTERKKRKRVCIW